MKRVTVKEIRRFMKTLEENRYRKLVIADARRVAWFVNNSMSEEYDLMPNSLRKKWEHAKYGKERYVASKYLESIKKNESVVGKIREIIREEIKRLSEEKLSSGEYQQLAKEFAAEHKRTIIDIVKDMGYIDIQSMVQDTVRALQYDPEYKGRVSGDWLYNAIEKELKKQPWFKKLGVKL